MNTFLKIVLICVVCIGIITGIVFLIQELTS